MNDLCKLFYERGTSPVVRLYFSMWEHGEFPTFESMLVGLCAFLSQQNRKLTKELLREEATRGTHPQADQKDVVRNWPYTELNPTEIQVERHLPTPFVTGHTTGHGPNPQNAAKDGFNPSPEDIDRWQNEGGKFSEYDRGAGTEFQGGGGGNVVSDWQFRPIKPEHPGQAQEGTAPEADDSAQVRSRGDAEGGT